MERLRAHASSARVMSFIAIFLFSGALSDHKAHAGFYLAFVIVTLALCPG